MTTHPTLDDLHDEATWLEWRSRVDHLVPVRRDQLATTEQSRAEFLEGARLLRLDRLTRAGDGGHGPTPIQLVISDLLTAGVFLNAVFEPRRASKTTSIQCVMVGRCRLREDYQVGWTMLTTGAKAGERFRKDIVMPIERLYPDPRTSPMEINKGKGSEHIYFKNGSYLNVYSPNGDGFRSGGFDLAFVDEGGEGEPDVSEDIQVAVIPTMDTKPGAQFVIAGTGGKFRAGNILWETLNDEHAAVLWHGIPETTHPDELEDWEPTPEHPAARMRELIEFSHPGVTFTTPIEAVERSFRKMPRDQFLREYGGQFGLEGATDTLIPRGQYAAVRTDEPFPADLPARVSTALKVHHLGTAASFAIAWEYEEQRDLVAEALDETPRTRRAVALWHHQPGTSNLDREVLLRLRRTGAQLGYDKHGYTETIVEKGIAIANPKPRMRPSRTGDIPKATVALLQGIKDGTVVVFAHPELDRAAGIAVRQSFGLYGSFRFGAPKHDPDADVTPLEAAALALHWLDDTPRTLSPTDVVDF
ncbi:MAG: hypothetical protein J0H96_01255 [Microbacterium ginsengisoli]|nr:hypothetical protein [Microbacterium ginsengisoli]